MFKIELDVWPKCNLDDLHQVDISFDGKRAGHLLMTREEIIWFRDYLMGTARPPKSLAISYPKGGVRL